MKSQVAVLIECGRARLAGTVRCARASRIAVLVALLAVLIHLALPSVALAAEPPPGFRDEAVVTVYGDPTDLAWLGDDLLIATANGWLFRLPSDAPPAAPIGTAQMILDLSERVGQGREQGLLGVVADPEFPSRPYIYVFYTHTRDSGHCLDAPANCANRVSRFTLGDDGLLDPASELPLLDSIMVGSMHNGGDLAFDADGLLYVTTGDAGHWPNSQDLGNLNGKILRIDRDGAPAPGNPLSGPDVDACDDRKPGDPPFACAEIYAYGLRNPFRLAFDPSDRHAVFYINDVGQQGWEEIDVGMAGADYGWPLREGPCVTDAQLPCDPSAHWAEPIFAYGHDEGCFSITGGAFVPAGSPWGPDLENRYLYADWGCGRIFVLDQDAEGRFTATPFAGDIPAITSLLFSPDGSALYYAYGGGEVDGEVGVITREAEIPA